MQLQQRIDLLVRLGEYMQENGAVLTAVREEAFNENPWFIPAFTAIAIQNIADKFLKRDKLNNWVEAYDLKAENNAPKTVGIVMAGNIPLVGFHDLLCVFITGHNAIIKPSSKDAVLIKHFVNKLYEWDSTVQNHLSFAEMLKGCDAYIATGNNNSGRYFEYYFGKYPAVIRKNRTSVAILDGTESEEELDALAKDIQYYFGLGCRNITKLYVPEEYDFIPLLQAVKKYKYFMEFHKYNHNYDYQLALLIMNNKLYMTDGSLILVEGKSVFSPISVVNYEFYKNRETLKDSLTKNADIQCISGHGFIHFGQAQSPSLTDYADGVDTMAFLSKL